jgi:hypothetical protein
MNTRDQAPPAAGATVESLDAQLRFAIANKRLLQLRYDGYRRIAEPHDYGVQRGVTRLLIYQTRKFGASGRSTGWRLLDTAKISECTVLDRAFPGTRARSDQRHHIWDVLHARVT